MKLLRKIPIFRRLFIALAIMAIVPSVLTVLLSAFYLSSLDSRSQAVQTSIDAQSSAADGQSNLQRMNALLQTRFTQIFATLSGGVNDPSLANSSGLIGTDIAARELNFSQTLSTFQSTYEVATAPDMKSIRSILLDDNPQTGPAIIADQQQEVSEVAGPDGLWAQYQQLQDQEVKQLDQLDPTQGNPAKHAVTLPQSQLAPVYAQAYSTLWKANFVYLDLKNTWQNVVDDAVKIGKTVTSVGPSQEQPILIATAFVTLFGIALVLLVGWVVNSTISSPLRALASLTRKIAQGHTEARASTDGRDEITTVATTMNNMLDNIVNLIQQTQSQRDTLQARVEKLVSEVCNVGEGDLRIQAEVTADALGVLADSFNYMVEELGGLIVRVKLVAQEVKNSTLMTFEHMRQLVESADIQIQQISGAAVEVERMASSSRLVAERAQSLYTVAREARQTAQTGRIAVQQTIEGMGRINSYVQDTAAKVQALGESSREIDNIVTAIASIAHQTNRLALDAAIQAAMAGANGKGFGAVATDIRRQAERAKEQAGQIARIVRSVREDIDAAATSMQDTEKETSVGAQLAQEAGIALESLFAVVERQSYEIEGINQLANQQFQSSNTVVQIMQDVSESTQRSSQSTHATAQNMEHLARLAEQLLVFVEAFKLHDNLDYPELANITVTPHNQQDALLVGSSGLRTITASNQPVGETKRPYSGPLANSNQGQFASSPPFPSMPRTPNPSGEGNAGTQRILPPALRQTQNRQHTNQDLRQ
jgi:methyl-accepting chemotaxis protein